jgi:hypothetical protein
MAMHDDALAQRLTLVLLGEVGIAFLNRVVAIDRALSTPTTCAAQ